MYLGCQLLLVSDGYGGKFYGLKSLWVWLTFEHDNHWGDSSSLWSARLRAPGAAAMCLDLHAHEQTGRLPACHASLRAADFKGFISNSNIYTSMAVWGLCI